MSYSMVTISHSWSNLDGTPSSGSVEFQLSGAMRNGSTTYAASNPIIVALTPSGTISVVLPANDDATTLPQGRMYQVTEKIAGAREETYTISVPSASAGQTIDLGTLYPQDEVAS